MHRRLGPADTAYVMGADGRVAGRSLWATDVAGIRRALAAAFAGETAGERRTRIVPVVAGASEMSRIFERAGPRASRDMLRVMPPVLLAGRIADRLPRWPPVARGAVACGVAFGLLGLTVTAAGRTVRRFGR
jgi:hypothetical protein